MDWLLRRLLALWVRYKVRPDDAVAQVRERDKPVCYVLERRSVTDLAVLQDACVKLKLPRPRKRLLPQADVSQSDLGQGFQGIGNFGHRAEKIHAFIHCHVQHIGNVFSLVGNFQRLAVVTLSITGLTSHIDWRQKIHFNHTHAAAFAEFTTTAFYIERKSTGIVSTNFGLGY